MSSTITVSYEQKPCYNIEIQHDFAALFSALKSLGYGTNKVCIITDSNVGALYLKEISDLLMPLFSVCTSFTFKAGELSKNTDTVGQVYTHLIEHSFDRKDVLIALGGGVVGDLTGFAAATFLRGIDFVQIPTSLLAQVDSSIGGKTGVDFMQYKNMVGAFYMPRLVYMNLSVLKSLPKPQLASGMGEIIKHGLIKDASYFQKICLEKESVIVQEPCMMEQIVARSCEIKRNVVEHDPKEQGERALLNFGHTIGHAIEKLSDFTLYHGECVALGMVGAGFISKELGTITQEDLQQIEQVIASYLLPVRLHDFPHTSTEILSVTKLDKKMESGKIKFILLNTIGSAYITKNITEEMILSGISYVMGESDENK
ncbi:MAG: 3-dehydroquinate synthase [Lachnospiraceae bacterium]